jgi:hypothetical protein
MWSDIRAAVDDVVTALESLIAALDDLDVVGLGVFAGLAGGWLAGYRKNPASLGQDGLSVLTERLVRGTRKGLDDAYDILTGADGAPSHYSPGAVDDIVTSAVHKANLVHEVGKWGGRGLLLASAGVTLWQTYDTAQTYNKAEHKKNGWGDAFEEHAGDWAGLAAGAAIGVALAPVGLPAIGAVVVGGIVATGVGDVVQAAVDHRVAISHAARDVGEWEVKHAEGLAKFL